MRMNYSNSYRKEMHQQMYRQRQEDSYNFGGLKKHRSQEVIQRSHKSRFIR